MKTDTSEKGLESLIVAGMTATGWLPGDPGNYEREYAVDLEHLRVFLLATQRRVAETLELDQDGPTRRKFLTRLQGEVEKRGVIDVLRDGVKHGAHDVDLFYGTPSPGNATATERYEQNRFSVTRQLRYSRDETQLALDLCLFINGLPVATFELIATLGSCSSTSDGASPTSRWMNTTYGSALTLKERHRGSCPSTRAGTMVPGIHLILTG
jgi:type I restriction enzyme R subunit